MNDINGFTFYKNYYEIIIFSQKNKIETNNFLIDEIINEDVEEKSRIN